MPVCASLQALADVCCRIDGFMIVPQCRHLTIREDATALVSGMSALEKLQSLDITLGDSLGSIGMLRALTSLTAHFEYEESPHIQLDLENPKLQVRQLSTYKRNSASFQVCAFASYILDVPTLFASPLLFSDTNWPLDCRNCDACRI